MLSDVVAPAPDPTSLALLGVALGLFITGAVVWGWRVRERREVASHRK